MYFRMRMVISLGLNLILIFILSMTPKLNVIVFVIIPSSLAPWFQPLNCFQLVLHIISQLFQSGSLLSRKWMWIWLRIIKIWWPLPLSCMLTGWPFVETVCQWSFLKTISIGLNIPYEQLESTNLEGWMAEIFAFYTLLSLKYFEELWKKLIIYFGVSSICFQRLEICV